MGVIFEFFLVQFISNTVGVYSRYLFYKIIGKKKSKEYLLGKLENENNDNRASQVLANFIVGFFVFFSFFFGILKLLDILGLLDHLL